MSTWDAAPKNSELLWSHLIDLASKMRVESYGEVAAAIGAHEGRTIAPVSLTRPLGFIRDEICLARGYPLINALVVNADSWRPGDCFLPAGVSFGRAKDVLWRASVAAVFAYPWDSVHID
ncbi:MAG: hypothetical protein RBS78_07955 [Coriobacteriia bacterium]|jgi:hypothetical protein|nr:hypothetical protein [Coriobacteriia bacterium]